jgi:sirohydrochlorin ferrochelatase
MLLDVHAGVRDDLLALPGVDGVRTAFMEYTEPSIATQLEAFDRDRFDRVILVPLLLTVSGHSFDDIPTIYGAKSVAHSVATLEAEGIARYSPNAEVIMTPLLDYAKLVRKNMARRIRSLSRTTTRDGVVLVGYGSEEFDAQWSAFFEELCDVARHEFDLATVQYCWCGHIVRYRKDPTVSAIKDVLKTADRALVVPLLVAFDEFFQEKIIGGAVKQVGLPDRVLYNHDSILPEPDVNRWVVEIVKATLACPRGSGTGPSVIAGPLSGNGR